MVAKGKSSSSKAKTAAAALKTPKSTKADKATKSMKGKSGKVDGRLKTGLDSTLVGKAVEALLKYHEKQNEDKLSLLGNDRQIQVQLTLLRVPDRSSPKPIRVLIPHPLYKLADKSSEDGETIEEPEVCLIVKEESKPWCQEMIDNFPDHMGCVKKVLGLQSLRKKHGSHEQRRELLNKYNFFMADDRILPMISKALGKEFFKAKKLPIPVTLTRKEALPFAIQKALSATYMTISSGTCVTIRAGHTGMSAEKLTENIVAIAKNAAPKVPHKWANIQVVSIKTPESIALPVYNKTPDALKELAKMAGLEEDIDVAEKEVEVAKKAKEDEDAKNRKKRDMQSPLVRALKKQKQVEKSESGKESKKKKKTEEKNKRKSLESKQENKDEATEKKPKAETPKKKRRTSSEGSIKEEKTSAKKKKAESDEKKDFIAAKKFKGSKKGYVFTKGYQGLGYYLDVPPKVDKAKIDAILRSSKGGRKSGGGKRNKGERRRSY